MKKHIKVRSAIPMLEIIIVIGFFSIISVFLLQLFASANRLQKEASDLSKSTMLTQSAAEVFKSTDSIPDALDLLDLSELAEHDSVFYVKYFDSGWNISPTVSKYTMKVSIETTEYNYGSIFHITIALQKEDSSTALYTLNTVKYIAKEAD